MGFYRLFILPALLIIISGLPLYSQDDPFYEEGWNARFSGYYKNLFMYQERDDFQGSILELPEKKKLVSDLNRLRLSPELDYAESFIFWSRERFKNSPQRNPIRIFSDYLRIF